MNQSEDETSSGNGSNGSKAFNRRGFLETSGAAVATLSMIGRTQATGKSAGTDRWTREWSLDLELPETQLHTLDSDADGQTEIAIAEKGDFGPSRLGLVDNGTLNWVEEFSAAVALGSPGNVDGQAGDEVVAKGRAGASWVSVYSHDGTRLWRSNHLDWTDRATAFDFDDDGRAEVIATSSNGGDVSVYDDDGTILVQTSNNELMTAIFDVRQSDPFLEILTPHQLSGARRPGLQLTNVGQDGSLSREWLYEVDNAINGTFLRSDATVADVLAVFSDSGEVHWLADDGSRLNVVETGLTNARGRFFDIAGNETVDAVVWSGPDLRVIDGASRELRELSFASPIRRVTRYDDSNLAVATNSELVIANPNSGSVTSHPVDRDVLDLVAGNIDGDNTTEVVVGFADEAVALEPTVEVSVTIDIKPGSDPNAINPGARGVIPVAILQTDEFDPVDRVNVESLRFGDPENLETGGGGSSGGAAPVHEGHIEDVDDDGDDDLLLHFRTQDTNFEGDEDTGKLVGETNDRTPLFGTDSVKLVGR